LCRLRNERQKRAAGKKELISIQKEAHRPPVTNATAKLPSQMSTAVTGFPCLKRIIWDAKQGTNRVRTMRVTRFPFG
jgi:hypothetical protein